MVKSDRESNLKEQIYTSSWGLSLPRSGKHSKNVHFYCLLGNYAPQSPDVALMGEANKNKKGYENNNEK